jgi:hypothetical protein
VRIPMKQLDFSTFLLLPAELCPMGSTQSLTEMSSRNLPGGAQPARKADNLTTTPHSEQNERKRNTVQNSSVSSSSVRE